MEKQTEVLDFLWGWAEGRGAWAKILVARLISKNRALNEEERNALYGYFLAEGGVQGYEVARPVSKPKSADRAKSVHLISLGGVKGVNRLSHSTEIKFHRSLTVIYGGNGTGKTGYVRVLRDLGRSYGLSEDILPDVYEGTPGQFTRSAKVIYKEGEHTRTFEWEGQGAKDAQALRRISVFSDRCARVGLSPTRQLLVTPAGFHLFAWASDELNALKAIHISAIDGLRKNVPSGVSLHPGTFAHLYLDKLRRGVPESLPEDAAQFGTEQVKALAFKQDELARMNADELERTRFLAAQRISELQTSLKILRMATDILNPGLWEAHSDALAAVERLEETQFATLEELARARGVANAESPLFASMVEAASAYMALRRQHDEHGAHCPYCQQLLHEDARALIYEYERALQVRDAEILQGSLEQAERCRTRALDVDTDIQLDPRLLASELFSDEQRGCLRAYERQLEQLRSFLRNNPRTAPPIELTQIDFRSVELMLSEAINKLSNLQDVQATKLRDLETHRTALTREIEELQDKLWLAGNAEDIGQCVERLRQAVSLEKLTGRLSTNAVTRKAAQARDALLSEELKVAFQEELKALHKDELAVDFNFNTAKGETRLHQCVAQSHAVPSVMSEGEQKAIALAEFFAELRLDASPAPVVFDDPVTSMDHELIEYVADRLVEVSKTRQVIVFTHNVILLACIRERNGARQDVYYYGMNKSVTEAGLVHGDLVATQGVRDYVEKIESQLDPSGWLYQNRAEAVAREGYGNLRSALEVFLETELLGDAVRRFRSNVAFGRLGRINGTLIEKHKTDILDLYGRCCSRLDGHSNPSCAPSTPTISDLEKDFRRFKKIREDFTAL